MPSLPRPRDSPYRGDPSRPPRPRRSRETSSKSHTQTRSYLKQQHSPGFPHSTRAIERFTSLGLRNTPHRNLCSFFATRTAVVTVQRSVRIDTNLQLRKRFPQRNNVRFLIRGSTPFCISRSRIQLMHTTPRAKTHHFSAGVPDFAGF